MEGNTPSPITLVCLVLSVVAIAVSGYAVLSDGPGDGYDDVRYTIYLGMGERTDAEILEVEDFVVSEMERFGFGYNVEREYGGYMDGDVPMKDRVTLKFVTTDRDDASVYEIIENTKARFGIQTVFLEKDLVDSRFV